MRLVWGLLLGLLLAVPAWAQATPRGFYEAYNKAVINSHQLEDLAPYLTRGKMGELRKLPAQKQVALLHLMKMLAPRDLRIVREKNAAPGRAELYATGMAQGRPTDKQRQAAWGHIVLVREQGAWKLEEESWANHAPMP